MCDDARPDLKPRAVLDRVKTAVRRYAGACGPS